MKCGVDAAISQPYVLPGFGCVSDCYIEGKEYGGYYPIIVDRNDLTN